MNNLPDSSSVEQSPYKGQVEGSTPSPATKLEHPKPEIIGPYRVYYTIFRADLAECIMERLDKRKEL